MNNLSMKAKLKILKSKSLSLRTNYQIPYELVHAISLLNIDTDINVINYLMSQCEHMLRVSSYYKKYKNVENEYNKVIRDDLIKFGFYKGD